MESAYDLKFLLAGLKGRGLDLAEDAAKIVFEEVVAWFEASAKLSANPYDDMAIVVLPLIKANALKAIDRIDGKAELPA